MLEKWRNRRAPSTERLAQKLSQRRGAGPRLGLWLLREFGTDEQGRPRSLLALYSIIGETFGVSDATGRRWVEGELAAVRYLEEMRQRWGLAFVVHLFDDVSSTPARQDAIRELREIDERRIQLLKDLGVERDSLLCAASASSSGHVAQAARIFAALVEAERREHATATFAGRIRARFGRA